MSALRARALLAAAIVLLAAAGCRGDEEPESTEPAVGSEGGGTLVAALGDSITAGSPGFDPDPGARQAYGFGDDERSSFGYWAEREDNGLEVRNCGVFGERTDEIAARLNECTDGADAVIVQGGINDIAQRYDVENAAANLRGIVVEAKDIGLPVAITDVLPWNNGYPDADPQIQAMNLLIAQIADEEKVPLLPFHDTLEDPAKPGRMKPEWTADGDHPSIDGYRRLGEIAFRVPASQ